MASKPAPTALAGKRGKQIVVAIDVKKGVKAKPAESARRAGRARAVKVASAGQGT
jgi:hypothetical protein